MSDIYQFPLTTIDNQIISMAEFKNKTLLIVNVASLCGFTPQYRELEELYQRYQSRGLIILAFPCNQFKQQEPLSHQEIKSFCQSKYQITFPLFAKIDVNGTNAIPLYHYLKQQRPGIFHTKAIKWNFTKFIVDKNGKVVKRFAPITKMSVVEKFLKSIL